MTWNQFIKNKKVCFVGASPILIDRGHGEFIDKFDVVVRTNGSVSLICDNSFQKDYGKRIDVLYTNNQYYREMSPLPIDKYIKRGVKYLRMKTCRPGDFIDFNKKLNCDVITKIMKKVNETNKTSTMGSYIFTDILECNPAELYITGVDFFASKKKVFEHDNYQEYVQGYLPTKIRNQGNRINAGKTEDGHGFNENAQYIYDLYKSHANMKFPPFILRILEDIILGKVHQK